MSSRNVLIALITLITLRDAFYADGRAQSDGQLTMFHMIFSRRIAEIFEKALRHMLFKCLSLSAMPITYPRAPLAYRTLLLQATASHSTANCPGHDARPFLFLVKAGVRGNNGR